MSTAIADNAVRLADVLTHMQAAKHARETIPTVRGRYEFILASTELEASSKTADVDGFTGKYILTGGGGDLRTGRIRAPGSTLDQCIFPTADRHWDYMDGYSFNQQLADQTLAWMKRYLTFTKGRWKGKPLVFDQWWQIELLSRLFGVVNAEGVRQYRRVLLFTPKKVGKTEMAASVVCRLFYRDGESTPEIFTLASDVEQAKICYKAAVMMVENSPALMERSKPLKSQRRILHKRNDGEFRVLSGKGPGKQGPSIHCAVVDEVHEMADREAYDAITNPLAYAAREQPVLMIVSTAGTNDLAFGKGIFDEAVAIQNGEKYDPRTLAYVFSAGIRADWKDEKVWFAVNTGLGRTTELQSFREQIEAAESSRIDEINTRVMGLNTWIKIHKDGIDEQYIQPEKWDELVNYGETEDDPSETMYGGLDLGLGTGDLSSFSWVIEREYGLEAFCHSFMPEEAVERRSKVDKVDYMAMVDEGHMTIMPGDVRDDEIIAIFIHGLWQTRKNGSRIGVDRYSAFDVSKMLLERHIEAVDIRQTYAQLNEATVKLRDLIRGVALFPGRNRLLKQAADNAIVSKNQAGYLKLDKAKNSHKIDPFQALVMGVDCWLRRPPKRKKYLGVAKMKPSKVRQERW